MTGRRLYDKYVDALHVNIRHEYSNAERKYVAVYPPRPVLAWPFLGRDVRDTFNALARSLTPPKRKASS